jgi:hypothetical protein
VASPRVSAKIRALSNAATEGNLPRVIEGLLEYFVTIAEDIRAPRPRVKRKSDEHLEGERLVAAWPWDDADAAEAHAWIAETVARDISGRPTDLIKSSREIVRLQGLHKAALASVPALDEPDPVEVRAQAWRQLLDESSVDELEEQVEALEVALRERLRRATEASRTGGTTA